MLSSLQSMDCSSTDLHEHGKKVNDFSPIELQDLNKMGHETEYIFNLKKRN